MTRIAAMTPPVPIMGGKTEDTRPSLQQVQAACPVLHQLLQANTLSVAESADGDYCHVTKRDHDEPDQDLAQLIGRIIPDQDWLNQQLRDGKSFLILDQSLELLTTLNSAALSSTRSSLSWPNAPKPAMLVIDKYYHTTPCDEVFLPSEVFQGRDNERSVRELDVRNVEPARRHIEIKDSGHSLLVSFPMTYKDASRSIWLDCHVYLPWVELEYIFSEQGETTEGATKDVLSSALVSPNVAVTVNRFAVSTYYEASGIVWAIMPLSNLECEEDGPTEQVSVAVFAHMFICSIPQRQSGKFLDMREGPTLHFVESSGVDMFPWQISLNSARIHPLHTSRTLLCFVNVGQVFSLLSDDIKTASKMPSAPRTPPLFILA
ncbi:hypothetical protein FH972_026615 [Carpinus fangiana]|uniref:Uncharacterized protein n=1 Tax=Carpinus fangiana TaxID=176857 RepID=A0A5N6L4I4_9ROSI|nr:hypothetical protein FH972_026615 [Carpinus fangiana]